MPTGSESIPLAASKGKDCRECSKATAGMEPAFPKNSLTSKASPSKETHTEYRIGTRWEEVCRDLTPRRRSDVCVGIPEISQKPCSFVPPAKTP